MVQIPRLPKLHDRASQHPHRIDCPNLWLNWWQRSQNDVQIVSGPPQNGQQSRSRLLPWDDGSVLRRKCTNAVLSSLCYSQRLSRWENPLESENFGFKLSANFTWTYWRRKLAQISGRYLWLFRHWRRLHELKCWSLERLRSYRQENKT